MAVLVPLGRGAHITLVVLAGVTAAVMLVPILIYGSMLGGSYGAPVPWGWSPILPLDRPDVFLPLPPGRPPPTFSGFLFSLDWAVTAAVIYGIGRWVGLELALGMATLGVVMAFADILLMPRPGSVRENPLASLYLWCVPVASMVLMTVVVKLLGARHET
jgi:hypothetical protein